MRIGTLTGLCTIAASIYGIVWLMGGPAEFSLPKQDQKAVQTVVPSIKNNEPDMAFVKAKLGVNALKESVRDPDSFKLETALIMDNGAVCYAFRAKNGFGGVNRIFAVFSSNQLKTNEMPGFISIWKKNCDGKSGKDYASLL